MPTMTDLIRAAARRTEIAPTSDALRAATNRGVVGADPQRDPSGRFAAANTPLEALAAVKGALRPATVAKLIEADGTPPAEQLAAIRQQHPELFVSQGSADGGARGAASTPAQDPIAEYRRSVGLL